MEGTGMKGGGGGQKQTIEHKAIQKLEYVSGDRQKFHEGNEKLLNALGQASVKSRRTSKHLSVKPETSYGTLQYQDGDDMVGILNNCSTLE
eukprot:8335522-Pyramimonas_sp.AAC.1